MEIRTNGEYDAAGARKTTESLAFAAEMMVCDGFVFFGCEPAYGGTIFGADGGGPGEGVVDLNEVVILLGC